MAVQFTRLIESLGDALDESVAYRAPGFVAGFPYFMAFRVLTAIGGIRSWYSGKRPPLWSLAILFLAGFLFELFNQPEPKFESAAIRKPRPTRLQLLSFLQVSSDLALVVLSGQPIFLVFPLWEGAELLRLRFLVLVSLLVLVLAVTRRHIFAIGSFWIDALPSTAAAFVLLASPILFFLISVELRGKERAARRREEFEALSAFNEDALKTAEPRKILARLINLVPQLMGPGVIGCGFMFNQEDGGVETVPSREDPDRFVGETIFLRQLHARLLKQRVKGEAIRVENCTEDADFKRIEGLLIRSLMAVPIFNHKVRVGALWVASSDKGKFGENAERFLRLLSQQIAAAIERDRLATAFRVASHLSGRTLDLDRALNRILVDLTERMGFEFASVSLVDNFRGVVEMIRGRNIPQGWIRRARFPLTHKDIQADVLRTGRTEKIIGWDERFNRAMFERYGHKDLGHFWVPVLCNGEPVAVIRGGCHRSQTDRLLTEKNKYAIEELAREMAPILAECRSHVLLEVIAEEAIRLIGAGSATLHVYRGSETIMQAAAGKKKSEFLAWNATDIAPIGPELRQSFGLVPSQVREIHPKLWSIGVRTMAAFPLDLGGDARGVLYVHFWDELDEFTESEQRLEQLFLQPMQGVIQNSLLLSGVTEGAQQALAASAFRSHIHHLAVRTDPAVFLADFVKSVRLTFDADLVTLFQYYPAQAQFGVPPIVDGQFHQVTGMQESLHETAIPYIVMAAQEDLFQTTLTGSPFAKSSFVEREKIRSVVALHLRVRSGERTIGMMFLNYRDQTDFSPQVQEEMKEMASIAAESVARARVEEDMSWPLRALTEVGRVAGQQREADDLLKSSLERVRIATNSARTYVAIWDASLASWQRYADDRPGWTDVNLPAPGPDAESGRSALDWQTVKAALPTEHSEGLTAPLSDQRGDLGVLVVEGPKCSAQQFFERVELIPPILAAIRLRQFACQVTNQIGQLRCLHQIAMRIQSFPHDSQTIMSFILTGVTAEEGLGFSRGVIFLWDEQRRMLVPSCAVGPYSLKEAEEAWEEVTRILAGIDNAEGRLNRLLRRVEELTAEDQAKFCQNLYQAVSNPDPALEGSVIQEAFRKARTLVASQDRDDPWRRLVRNEAEPKTEVRVPFVCVPIRQGDRVQGVLVADNRFLRRQMVLDCARIPHLEAFAELCAASLASADYRTELSRTLGETRRDVKSIVRAQSQLALEQRVLPASLRKAA